MIVLEIRFRKPPRLGRPSTLYLHTHAATPAGVKALMLRTYGVEPTSVRRIDRTARELCR